MEDKDIHTRLDVYPTKYGVEINVITKESKTTTWYSFTEEEYHEFRKWLRKTNYYSGGPGSSMKD